MASTMSLVSGKNAGTNIEFRGAYFEKEHMCHDSE
jgi:hypothetical protein